VCIIVDANVAAQLCQAPLAADARLLVEWIENRGGRVVLGGQLSDELASNSKVSRWLRGLAQAGRAILVPRDTIEEEEHRVRGLVLCVSNDFHIIALARVSGARLLFSHDHDLHTDFGNRGLINNPRGRIYQNAAHRHLLSKTACRG
jgi:hypothetical protein